MTKTKNPIPPEIMRRSDSAFWKLRHSKDAVWTDRWTEWHETAMARSDYQQWYEEFMTRKDERFVAYVAALSAVTVPTKRKAIKQFLACIGTRGKGKPCTS